MMPWLPPFVMPIQFSQFALQVFWHVSEVMSKRNIFFPSLLYGFTYFSGFFTRPSVVIEMAAQAALEPSFF
jgi:hypothetical protein